MLLATGTSSISEAEVIYAGAQGLIRKGPTFVDDLRERVSQMVLVNVYERVFSDVSS